MASIVTLAAPETVSPLAGLVITTLGGVLDTAESTIIAPTIPRVQCGLQKYGKVPPVLNCAAKLPPAGRSASHNPLVVQLVPLVVVWWKVLPLVHRTTSPALTRTIFGAKVNPLMATSTSLAGATGATVIDIAADRVDAPRLSVATAARLWLPGDRADELVKLVAVAYAGLVTMPSDVAPSKNSTETIVSSAS